MEDLKKLYTAILDGDATAAHEITEKALAAGANPVELVNDHMIPAMGEVGRRFECNEFFVPELLIAARANTLTAVDDLRLAGADYVLSVAEVAGDRLAALLTGDEEVPPPSQPK